MWRIWGVKWHSLVEVISKHVITSKWRNFLKSQIFKVFFLKLIIKISMFKDYSKGIKYVSEKKKKRKNKTKSKSMRTHTPLPHDLFHTHTHHPQSFSPAGRTYLRLRRRFRRQAMGRPAPRGRLWGRLQAGLRGSLGQRCGHRDERLLHLLKRWRQRRRHRKGGLRLQGFRKKSWP